ncbi:MAG: DUF4382 domain-containing protein [Bacteroidales bacterium]|nr:DUF4382 domain-containing protein [Bacteroidales bacterium]
MKNLIFSMLAVGAIIMGGCNEAMNSGDEGKGRLVVKITDDPFDISYIESATVTITKVEIRRVGDGVPDGNPFMVLSDDTVTIDLIDLRNGLTQTLIDMEIEDGEYDLVRLYVDEAGLKLKDIEDPYKVKVPSGEQTGIKIFISPALSVSGGLTEELLLDVDLSRSFILRGNMNHNNGFIFKPVIRAANMTTAGRIEGMVKDTAKVKVKEAKVWITQDTTVATAFADTMGYYAIIGVPAGTYSIFATKEGYDTVKYENISVLAASKTVRDFILTKK